jgi:ribosome biogenesis GTPase A
MARTGMTGGNHIATESGSLPDLIAQACTLLPVPSTADIESRLQQLLGRLKEQRLQLAVLGQFKRGKSTFLNALLGVPVLPMAVTPLTAIPTFIESGGNFHLRTLGLDGAVEDIPAANVETLHSLLQARVTEEGNPHNKLNLVRVDVTLPSALVHHDLTLIDTPGIGSIYRHNTETAEAILPECDAALFIVSPDPPMTGAELEYLARIRKAAPHIVLVLNKIDILEDDADRAASIDFLRRIAAEKAGLRDAPIFCVSARRALRAKMAGDQKALEASGFAAIERYLADFIASEKTLTLERAIASKAAALVGELKFEAESRLAALRMPIDDLSKRIAQFERAAVRFEAERNTSGDLIAGDRKRILAELDTDAAALRARMRNHIEEKISTALGAGQPEEVIVAALEVEILALFQTEFARDEVKTRQRFAEALSVHRARAGELIAHVRRTAADLLAIGYAAPAPEEAFALKKLPYWVTKARETLRVIPPGAIDRLLPAARRRRRVQERLAREAGEVIRRNVENLRWSLRQNLEDGFRLFESRLDEQLQLTLEATREALRQGLQQRSDSSTGAICEIAALTAASQRLSQIAQAIAHSPAHRRESHGISNIKE